MIVVDSNVLVYAASEEHPLVEPSRRLIEAATEGRLRATSTIEVIQEFAHVYGRRRDRGAAAALARNYATLLTPLLVADEEILRRGLRLFERHSELDAFDAVLAAAALRREVDALVSADRAFAFVPGLSHVTPGSAEFERLLA